MGSSTIVSNFSLGDKVSIVCSERVTPGIVIGISLNRYNVIRILVECTDTTGRPFVEERAQNQVTTRP